MERQSTNDTQSRESVDETSAVERVRAKRQARRRKARTRKLMPVVAVCVLLVVCYAVGAWYFSDHYYPATTVSGVDASWKGEQELAQTIDVQAEQYKIDARHGDFSFVATGEQLGVVQNGVELAHKVREEMHPLAWPVEVLGKRRDAYGAMPYDAGRLASMVRKAVEQYNETAKLPTDASMKLDESGTFVIVEGEPGTAIDKLRVYSVLQAAVSDGQQEVALDDTVTLKAPIEADAPATKQAVERANRALDLAIPITYGGKQIHTLTRDEMTRWVKATPDLKVEVRRGLFALWADTYLSGFVDHEDDVYAYVCNGRKCAKTLTKVLNSGEAKPVKMPIKEVARYSRTSESVPKAAWDAAEGRYVEVDVAHQFARLYSATGNVLWETDVVTGNVSEGNETPLGTYSVYDKKNDFVLLGADKDDDGEYDYEVHVKYWMPFNLGVGFHDADWRDAFGGDIYLNDGSSGCVNLPPEAAKVLFTLIHMGDVVIVHV